MMNSTYRLIDDITVINSDGVSASHLMDIYENSDDNRANV